MIDTTGGEWMLVSRAGEDGVMLAIEDQWFGRIATVRLDADQAGDLAAALHDALGASTHRP
jgi:hypothetical protein